MHCANDFCHKLDRKPITSAILATAMILLRWFQLPEQLWMNRATIFILISLCATQAVATRRWNAYVSAGQMARSYTLGGNSPNGRRAGRYELAIIQYGMGRSSSLYHFRTERHRKCHHRSTGGHLLSTV
jgi:hypothetical protein